MRRLTLPAVPPAVPRSLSRVAAEVEYPSSDGKPMAENDAQRAAILYGIGALEVRYAARRDVYVSGDLLMYYEEGNPRASVAPDVFVVFGVEDRMRMNYKVWEEGKGPDFVLEVASPGTWREAVGRKRVVYARLGVKEYWLYDPMGEHLKPALQGYRLASEGYERQPLVESVDGTLSLCGETLGLDLWAKGGKMRFRDPETGLNLLSHEEEHAAWQAAVARVEREAAAHRNVEVQAGPEAAARQREAATRRDTEVRAGREASTRRNAEVRAGQEAAARQREAAARRAAEARVAELEALLDAKRG